MDLKLEALSRYIVTSPSWVRSLTVIVLLCGCVELMAILGRGKGLIHPTLFPLAVYLLPALVAFGLTPWLTWKFRGKLTYEWSGLTAAIGLVLSLLISLSPVLLISSSFPVFFAISLAFLLQDAPPCSGRRFPSSQGRRPRPP